MASTLRRRMELARRGRDARRLRACVGWSGGAALKPLYSYAWFVGFIVAGVLHGLFNTAARQGRRT